VKEKIEAALSQIKYPGFSRDIVSFGLIQGIDFSNGEAVVRIGLTTDDSTVPNKIKVEAQEALLKVEGIEKANIYVTVSKPNKAPGGSADQGKLGNVKYAIAVASGKGGVGKSTFSVNLACAFQKLLGERGGGKVGILDCDIYGPSVPLMMGLSDRPEVEEDKIIPLEKEGIEVMSMGFLVDDDAPVIWRGPMIMKTIQQFVNDVKWGDLEVLVVDLPPGTGDAHLSLTQTIPLDGAVVVTTPQKAAVNVAKRGARMFEKVSVPLLGVAENMSYLLDEKTGEKTFLFGEGGGVEAANDLETEFLGQIPLDSAIREGGDIGTPIVKSNPGGVAGSTFLEMASRLLEKLNA
tara:strand:+ start:627 stop:1673 length:1047 start_codon:yes stop_codon:yes gene_type:complete